MAEWVLTSLQLKLTMISARVARHARAITFQLAEVAVTGAMVRAIGHQLPVDMGAALKADAAGNLAACLSAYVINQSKLGAVENKTAIVPALLGGVDRMPALTAAGSFRAVVGPLNLRGVARDHHLRLNIFGYDGPGGDHGARADGDPIYQDCATANDDARADAAVAGNDGPGMKGGIAPDGAVMPDGRPAPDANMVFNFREARQHHARINRDARPQGAAP